MDTHPGLTNVPLRTGTVPTSHGVQLVAPVKEMLPGAQRTQLDNDTGSLLLLVAASSCPAAVTPVVAVGTNLK